MNINETNLKEEQYNFLTNLVMKSVKKPLAISIIRNEIAEIEQFLESTDAASFCNSMWSVNWGYCEKYNGFNLTDEQQKEYDTRRDVCEKANNAIFVLHRLESILAKI